MNTLSMAFGKLLKFHHSSTTSYGVDYFLTKSSDSSLDSIIFNPQERMFSSFILDLINERCIWLKQHYNSAV